MPSRRDHFVQYNASLTGDQKKERDARIKKVGAEYIANETEAQKKKRGEKLSENWADETEEQKKKRLAGLVEYRANETEEQKQNRLAGLAEYLANETEEQKQNRLAGLAEYLANETEEQKQNRLAGLAEYTANLSEADRQAHNAKVSQGLLKRQEAERKAAAAQTLQTAIANGHSPAQVQKKSADKRLAKLQKEKEEYDDETHKLIPLVVTCGACDQHFIHNKYKIVQIWSDDGKELLLTMKVPKIGKDSGSVVGNARAHIEQKTVAVRTRIEGQLTIQREVKKCRLTGDPNDCSCSKFREVLHKAVNGAVAELRKEHELRYGLEANWNQKERREFEKKKFAKCCQVIGEEIDKFEDENGIERRMHESMDRLKAKIKEYGATVGKNRKPLDLLDGIDLINGWPELKSDIEELIAQYKVEYAMIKETVTSELKSDKHVAAHEENKLYRVPKVNAGDYFIIEHYEIIAVQLSIALLMLYDAGALRHCDYCNCKLFLGEEDVSYRKGLDQAIGAAVRKDEFKKNRELTEREKKIIQLRVTPDYKRNMHGFFFSLDRRFNGAGHFRLSNLNCSCFQCNCYRRNSMSYEDWIDVMAEDQDGLYEDGPFKEMELDIPDLRERLQAIRLKGRNLDIINIPSVIALQGNNQWKAALERRDRRLAEASSDDDEEQGHHMAISATSAASSSSRQSAFDRLLHNNNNNNNNDDDENENNVDTVRLGKKSSSSSSSSFSCNNCKISCLNRTQNQNGCKCPCHRMPTPTQLRGRRKDSTLERRDQAATSAASSSSSFSSSSFSSSRLQNSNNNNDDEDEDNLPPLLPQRRARSASPAKKSKAKSANER